MYVWKWREYFVVWYPIYKLTHTHTLITKKKNIQEKGINAIVRTVMWSICFCFRILWLNYNPEGITDFFVLLFFLYPRLEFWCFVRFFFSSLLFVLKIYLVTVCITYTQAPFWMPNNIWWFTFLVWGLCAFLLCFQIA